MDALTASGHELIVAIQAWRAPFFDLLFRVLTFMGEREFLLALLPATLWVIDKHLAMRLLPLFVVSVWLNSLAKALGAHPRPFDPRVVRLVTEDGFGLPSGHAQTAVILWGFLASQSRRWWAVWAAALLVLGIGFSRVYLGVHFLHDVVAGWLLGLALLLGYLVLLPTAEVFWQQRSLREQILLGVGMAVALALVFSSGDAAPVTGVLAGAAVAIPIETRRVGFEAGRGAVWQKVARLILGVIVVFVLRLALKALLPETGLADFIRYTIIGLWATGVAPWLFVSLHLAPAATRAPLVPSLETAR